MAVPQRAPNQPPRSRQASRGRQHADALTALSGLQAVGVPVTVEWGRTDLTLAEALNLGPNALLRTSSTIDEPVEVRVNGQLFGRGKLVLVGGNYAVQLTEVIPG